MPPFDKVEYIERVNRIKREMKKKDVDVLITSNPANMNYISGYDGFSFYVPQAVILNLDEEEPTWMGRGIDRNGARLTTWLKEDNIRGYSDDYVQSDTRHPMSFLADILREKGLAYKCIGLEMEQEYLTCRGFWELQKGLPKASFKDISYLVNRKRMVKSSKEMEYLKIAGSITESIMEKGMQSIGEGIRECQVAADVYHAHIYGTEEHGGDYPAIIPLMPSGERTSTAHLSWTDRRYEKGETVFFELAGCKNRYHVPLARTILIGEQPSGGYRKLANIVIEGLQAMLDHIRPGVTCESVEETWRKTIQKYGIVKESRVGYPIGLGYPPDWGEKTASMRQGDKTILEPNMTFHVLPALWLDENSFVTSESIRVTEKGCETLCNFPQELFVK